MSYEIRKIDVTAEALSYDNSYEFATYKEVQDELDKHSSWFVGRGSHVLKGGKVIFSSDDYKNVEANQDKKRPTLRDVIEYAQEV